MSVSVCMSVDEKFVKVCYCNSFLRSQGSRSQVLCRVVRTWPTQEVSGFAMSTAVFSKALADLVSAAPNTWPPRSLASSLSLRVRWPRPSSCSSSISPDDPSTQQTSYVSTITWRCTLTDMLTYRSDCVYRRRFFGWKTTEECVRTIETPSKRRRSHQAPSL